MSELFLIPNTLVDSHVAAPEAPLTLGKRGHTRLRGTVSALRRVGVRFDALVHAPDLGSLITADALAVLLDGESIVTAQLTSPWSEALLGEITGACVVLVADAHHLSSLAGWLVFEEPPRRAPFVLEPAGLAWLTGDLRRGEMRLRGLFPPPLLRKLARPSSHAAR